MTRARVLREFTRGRHRHSECVADAIRVAMQNCESDGLRLTTLRKRVLELVWMSHGPIKAYDILDAMHGDKKRVAPPTVYRALDFLLAQGLVHKIESLNAYVGCGSPGHSGTGQLLICRDCGEVAEIDDPEITDLLDRKSQELGFAMSGQVIEVEGVCTRCQAR